MLLISSVYTWSTVLSLKIQKNTEHLNHLQNILIVCHKILADTCNFIEDTEDCK